MKQLLSLCCWLALAASAIAGSTNVVTTATDAALRSAIATGGWVSFTCTGTIGLTNSITITNNVILDGTGVNLVISGGSLNQIFLVPTGASLSLTNLVLANGAANSSTYAIPAAGGAIDINGGTVSLVNCVLTNNGATNTAVNSSYSVNNAGSALGGAICNNGGTLSLFGCSLSNNSVSSAFAYGGALYSTNGTVTLVNSLVAGNTSYYDDYNIYNETDFYHWSYGGGVCLNSGFLNATNTALNGNQVDGMSMSGLGQWGSGPNYSFGGGLAILAGTANVDSCQFLTNGAVGGAGINNGEENGYLMSGQGEGGAIWSVGVLTATRSAFSGNTAITGSGDAVAPPLPACGGAVFNSGTAVLNGCQISSNTVTANTNATVYNNRGHYVSANGTSACGGGVYNGGQLTVTNTTIALNLALGGLGSGLPHGNALGGGIFNTNTLVTMNVTLASNQCVTPGGNPGFTSGAQISNTNGVVQLHNTLLAYGGTNANYYGPLTDLGYNLNSDASAPFTSGTSTNSLNPLLAPLANYGGPTLAMNLLPASPAIGTGDTNGAPATDQRGYPRIFAYGIDIGAVQGTTATGTNNTVNIATDAALRSAIAAGGWVSFTCNGTIGLTNSIAITNNVILDGTGVNLVLSGGGSNQIFVVSAGATLSVTNLTLANGVTISTVYSITAAGGAIDINGGTVTLVDCLLTNNAAINNVTITYAGQPGAGNGGLGADYETGSALGGALCNNGGTLSLFGCTLSNNGVMSTYSYGGAIFTTNGTTTIVSSQLSSNSCYYEDNYALSAFANNLWSDHYAEGGAVCQNSGTLNLTNTSLTGNLAYGVNFSSGASGNLKGVHLASGGSLANLAGAVNLDSCQFTGNAAHGGNGVIGEYGGVSAGGGNGGAVSSAGTLAATHTSFAGNLAEAGQATASYPTGQGGAIFNNGTAVLNQCQVSSNTVTTGQVYYSIPYNGNSYPGSPAFGGGIFNGGQFALTNCTIALNLALGGQGYHGNTTNPVAGSAFGGGVFSTNILATMNVTIASNSCVSPGNPTNETTGLMVGGQICNSNGTVQLHNTLLAYGNTNGNYYGPLTDLGHNLNSDASAPFTSGTSTNSLNPLLAPLANYGGPTLAMNLLPASPAIGTGDTNGAPATDQRGYYRYPAGTVDIGAVQFYGGTNLQPVIVTQPASQTVALGNPGLFSVIATGVAPLACQWQQNGTNLPGATNATLLLTNVLLSQSGYEYSVTITNTAGSALSSNAWLTVAGPLLAVIPGSTNNQFGFTAVPAKTYDLLVSSNLITWTTQQVVGPFGTSSNFTLPLASPTNGARFYRLWQP